MTDTWMGDDFFHQGAFRLSYGFEYAPTWSSSKDKSVPLPIGTWDTYDWYLELGPLGNVDAKYFHGRVPTWSAFVAHPTLRRLLAGARGRAAAQQRPRCRRSRWAAGGTRRTAGARSPLTARSSAATPARRNYLVMGPWNHGGWRSGERAPMRGGRSRHRRRIPARRRGAVVRVLAQGQGQARPQPEAYLYDAGAQAVAVVRHLAAQADGGGPEALPPRRRPAFVRRARRRRAAVRPVRLRSRAPGAVPPAPRRADLRPARLALAQLGDARTSGSCDGPARRAELGLGAARPGPARSPAM